MQHAVFRHEQIKILRCPHLKGAAAQHGFERIWRLEAGKLQYSFIHGKHHGLARAFCPYFHRQLTAGTGHGFPPGHGQARLKTEFKIPPFHVHGKRLGQRGMRPGKDILVIRRAEIGDVKIGPPLKIGRQGNFLNVCSSLGTEPVLRHHAFAFHGNQPRTLVRRGQHNLHGFAGVIVLLVQVDAQYGVAQRVRQDGGRTRHDIGNACQNRTVGGTRHQHFFPGSRSIKQYLPFFRAETGLNRRQRRFTAHIFIAVHAAVIADQALCPGHAQGFQRHFAQCARRKRGVHGQQRQFRLAALRQPVQL